MQNPLKIYLADLTFDTVGLRTAVFPLNIGYIASYCYCRFGSKVEITLFKYIDELDRAINESPPDILGMSSYVWNHRVGLEMFRMLSQKNPYALKIWGGPNFPMDPISQKKFLKKFPEVDIYVPIEGEVGFSNIIEKVLEIDSKEEIREKLLFNQIDNCILLDSNDELKFDFSANRLKNLDEIPSPYLTKLMDKFFDDRLSPMLQTNRGCPFACTFCVDGADAVNKVNSFSLERVYADIDYISNHVTKKMHDLEISDLNFGMYPRDREICEYLAQKKNENDFPHDIHVSTGKNQKEKIIQAIKILESSIRLYMSVQSMDQEVLTNIKRDNISVNQMLALAPAIKNSGLDTTCEVILGLPGESYKSHLQTLGDLLHAKMDHILTYSCMVLIGSEIATPQEREKWGLKTKFRILVKDFAKLSNGKKVIEIEEIVVSSNTLSFNDYLRCREVDFTIYAINNIPVFQPILKLLNEHDVELIQLFSRITDNAINFPNIKKIFNRFRQLTKDELWNSPEELEAHYKDEAEFQKLLNGESALNIMYYYTGQLLSENFEEWVEYVNMIAHELLKETKNFDDMLEKQFLEVNSFCKGMSHNILGNDSLTDNPEYDFEYDIINWLKDTNNSSLRNFKLSTLSRINFCLSDEQFEQIQNNLNSYGKIISSWAPERKGGGFVEVIKNLWRNPIISKSKSLLVEK